MRTRTHAILDIKRLVHATGPPTALLSEMPRLRCGRRWARGYLIIMPVLLSEVTCPRCRAEIEADEVAERLRAEPD